MAMAAQCRICSAGLQPRFSLPVLHGRHTAHYHECTRCHALQVPHATWLAEAYADDPTGRRGDPDTARFRRNFSALRYVTALIDGLVIQSPATFLDFGSGTGLLTAMLLDAGFDAWTTDAYVDEAILAPDRSVAWGQSELLPTYDCITALEVFEHLSDPIEVGTRLRALLRPGGCLVVSTSVYRPGEHGPEWPYLSTEWGQHVTFWSEQSLLAYASKLGYPSLAHFPGRDGFLIVFSTKEPADLADGLSAAARALEAPTRLQAITDAWDFRGDVFEPVEPRVIDVGASAA